MSECGDPKLDPSAQAQQLGREWELAERFVKHIEGTRLMRVVEPSGERAPDFTFLDSEEVPCALELTRMLLSPTQERELVEFRDAVTRHPSYAHQGDANVWVDCPDGLPPPWLWEYDYMVSQAVTMINEGVERGHLQGWDYPNSTNPPKRPGVMRVRVFEEGSGRVEVARGTPWDLMRPDLLEKKDSQLAWGKRQGMRGILLWEVSAHDSATCARRLAEDLQKRDYPNIDDAWVAFPDKPGRPSVVMQQAYGRTRGNPA